MSGKIAESLRLGYDQTGLILTQNQQGITGFNSEEFPGFLGNYDLAPVAHFGGAENPLFVFA